MEAPHRPAPVQSRKDAIEKLEWYAMRWKIEMFHKILKSGCKAEESRLRTAERLANLISLFCILELAHLLDDDAQPIYADRATKCRLDRDRNRTARRPRKG